MSEALVLGIDCGGTHTDAALLAVDNISGSARLLASAKTLTRHDDLPASITEVIAFLLANTGGEAWVEQLERVTLGTTLEINALVQGKAAKVGLALSAGPGLDPAHFGLGDHICIVPGGLDHRGVEVEKLYLNELRELAASWPEQGVEAIACVGKFSPRNPEHEERMASVCGHILPVTMGHKLSGRLNFPRRIATAYYNAAIAGIHEEFLAAVEQSLRKLRISAQCRLLKADGGAIPFAVSRQEPVQSVLSGPAASVMGVLSLWPKAATGCSLLLDMGGTTTDIAMLLDGSPIIDRQGMELQGRRTLVKSLASLSIGVGGDSALSLDTSHGTKKVCAGPDRKGPAMAFGGERPTLLDALNVLDGGNDMGDIAASARGIAELAAEADLEVSSFAALAVEDAMAKVTSAVYQLVEKVNSRPVYTLAALKAAKTARPTMACIAGGPADCIRARLERALGMPVDVSPEPQIANAIGAALTIPTASLEIYADTGRRILSAPALGYEQPIPATFTLGEAKSKACELLRQKLMADGVATAAVEVVEADSFATLDDAGRGAMDMRVSCQVRPGIAGFVEPPRPRS